MRVLRVLLLLVFSSALFAQTDTLKSIVVSDMNKSADPCDNFFDYANGAWRSANPIPASMPRWSRRWKAGEENKEALKTILDDVAKPTNYPKGSVTHLMGYFYGGCMDESHINGRGAKPVEPLLHQIDAMKSPADVQKMIRKLHDIG